MSTLATTAPLEEESYSGGPNEHGAEVFVDAGMNVNQVRSVRRPTIPNTTTPLRFRSAFRRGCAPRRDRQRAIWACVSNSDEVNGHSLIGVRAIDYRHRYNDSFALGLFAGVDRYNLATPAYSIYFGAGAQWRNFLPVAAKWDLGFDFRYAQNVARDHMLATDVQTSRPDSFYKIESAVLYLSRRF